MPAYRREPAHLDDCERLTYGRRELWSFDGPDPVARVHFTTSILAVPRFLSGLRWMLHVGGRPASSQCESF